MSAHADATSTDGLLPGSGADLKATTTGIENKKMLMWAFLASDCMFFGTLISTHLIYRKIYPGVGDTEIGRDPTKLFSLELTTFSTFVLLMSSFLMALGVSAMHKGDLKSFRRNVLGVIIFGLIFLGCQTFEFYEFFNIKGLSLQNNIFGSTFFVLTGTHGTHVAIGVFWLVCMWLYSFTGRFTQDHAMDVEVAGLYWHFVDIVWLVIFPAVYLVEFIGKLN